MLQKPTFWGYETGLKGVSVNGLEMRLMQIIKNMSARVTCEKVGNKRERE